MDTYEFNITVIGTGTDVDSAFSNALDSIANDPTTCISGEVVYVKKTTDDAADERTNKNELEN